MDSTGTKADVQVSERGIVTRQLHQFKKVFFTKQSEKYKC